MPWVTSAPYAPFDVDHEISSIKPPRGLRHRLPPRPAAPVREIPYHPAQRSVQIVRSGGYGDFQAFAESFGPVENCWVHCDVGRVDFFRAEDARQCVLSGAGDWRTGDVRIETGACVGRDSITQAGGGVARMSSWVIPRMKQLEKHLLRNGDAGTCQWKVSGSKATDGYQALGSTESGNQTNVPSISTWRSQETTRREAR